MKREWVHNAFPRIRRNVEPVTSKSAEPSSMTMPPVVLLRDLVLREPESSMTRRRMRIAAERLTMIGKFVTLLMWASAISIS